jgi:hypothetical protein
MTDSLDFHAGCLIGRCPGQLSGEIDDQVVLLSIETGNYFHFNTVGSRIWSLIETPMATKEIIERLVAEFAVDRATCDREVTDFLSDLSAHRLISVESDGCD